MPKPAASFHLRGVRAMQSRLRKLAAETPDKVSAALFLEAELIVTRAKKEFVPVDLGSLRSSGHVQEPSRKGKDISVTMAFGGPAAPYAIPIHEYPSPHNPPSWEGVKVTFHPPGRGAKYLEMPMNEATKDMASRLARRLKAMGVV